jgi:phospholipid N-methyltransferase
LPLCISAINDRRPDGCPPRSAGKALAKRDGISSADGYRQAREIVVTTAPPGDRATFLRSFLRDWRRIGSVTPSSRFLVGAMLDRLDFGQVRRIVEYGPGTGVFTAAALRRLAPDGQLLALDTEAHFIAALRARLRDDRLIAVPGSAAAVERHVAALGWPGADAIISGIPYTTMPAPLRAAILRASARALAPGGRFLAYQYSPYIRPLLGQLFGRVETRWEPRNLPPAFYFDCRRTKDERRAERGGRGSNDTDDRG